MGDIGDQAAEAAAGLVDTGADLADAVGRLFRRRLEAGRVAGENDFDC